MSFKIYPIGVHYGNTYDKIVKDDKVFCGDIDEVCEELSTNDEGYHTYMKDTKKNKINCTFFGDIDHANFKFSFFSKRLCKFLKKEYKIDIKDEDISYTRSNLVEVSHLQDDDDKEETKLYSYHYSIPKLYSTIDDLVKIHKQLSNQNKDVFNYYYWDNTKKDYKDANVVDSAFYTNNFFRLPMQTKPATKDKKYDKNNYHIIKRGQMKDFVIEYVDKDATEIKANTKKKEIELNDDDFINLPLSKKKKTKKTKKTDNVVYDDIDEIYLPINPLDKVEFKIIATMIKDCIKPATIDNRDIWIKIAYLFKSRFGDKYGLYLWEYFSKKGFNTCSHSEYVKTWNGIKLTDSEKQITVASIYKLAKDDDPDTFKKIMKTFEKDIKQKNCLNNIQNIIKAIVKSDDEFMQQEHWDDLCKIIYNEIDDKESGVFLFDCLSQTYNKNNYNKEKCKEQYYAKKIKKDSSKKIDILYDWLQKLEPEHDLISSRNNIKYKFANTHTGARDIIYKEVKDIFKSCRDRLFLLQDNVWLCDINKIDVYMLSYISNSNIYAGKDKNGNLIPYIQKIANIKAVRELLYSEIKIHNNDDSLYDKFHSTTKDKVCFEDGVLDFANKTFTLWEDIPQYTIYTTVKINRCFGEYFKNPDVSVIEDLKNKIFEPAYSDKYDVALQFLSRAITGNTQDKRWATYMGNRSSGKGVEYELLKHAFGDYVSSFILDNIATEENNRKVTQESARSMYWLLDLEFVRLAVSQEISDHKSGKVIDSSILKKITGGKDTIVARRNFDRIDTHFNIDSTFYIKGNNSIKLTNQDCNEQRLEFSSVTQFKSKEDIYAMRDKKDDKGNPKYSVNQLKRYRVADDKIKDKCCLDSWKNATVLLLMEYYRNEAAPIINQTDIDDEDNLMDAIKNKFNFTHNDDHVITQKQVFEIMSAFDKKKVHEELKAEGIQNMKCRKRVDGCRDKICYFGIQIIEEEEEDD